MCVRRPVCLVLHAFLFVNFSSRVLSLCSLASSTCLLSEPALLPTSLSLVSASADHSLDLCKPSSCPSSFSCTHTHTLAQALGNEVSELPPLTLSPLHSLTSQSLQFPFRSCSAGGMRGERGGGDDESSLEFRRQKRECKSHSASPSLSVSLPSSLSLLLSARSVAASAREQKDVISRCRRALVALIPRQATTTTTTRR